MKPVIEKFTEVMTKAGGNVSAVAKAFGVNRSTVYEWMQDPEYKQVLDDARGSFFDEVLTTSRVVARGIPDIQNGRQVGWITPPDSGMLRYLLGTLGRLEGFGETIEIKADVTKRVGLTPQEAKDLIRRFEEEY